MSNNVIKLIKRTQIFRDLLDKEVSLILDRCNVILVKENELILKKGDKQSNLIIILEGTARLERRDGSKVQLGAGSFFGELNLLEEDLVATNIYADTEEVHCLSIPFKHIDSLYSENLRIYGVIMANLAKMLATRLKKAR